MDQLRKIHAKKEGKPSKGEKDQSQPELQQQESEADFSIKSSKPGSAIKGGAAKPDSAISRQKGKTLGHGDNNTSAQDVAAAEFGLAALMGDTPKTGASKRASETRAAQAGTRLANASSLINNASRKRDRAGVVAQDQRMALATLDEERIAGWFEVNDVAVEELDPLLAPGYTEDVDYGDAQSVGTTTVLTLVYRALAIRAQRERQEEELGPLTGEEIKVTAL